MNRLLGGSNFSWHRIGNILPSSHLSKNERLITPQKGPQRRREGALHFTSGNAGGRNQGVRVFENGRP